MAKDHLTVRAKIVDEIVLTCLYNMGNVRVGETMCCDHEEFRSLPNVVEVDGVKLGKSAWNSDFQKAVYRSDKIIAKPIYGLWANK